METTRNKVEQFILVLDYIHSKLSSEEYLITPVIFDEIRDIFAFFDKWRNSLIIAKAQWQDELVKEMKNEK